MEQQSNNRLDELFQKAAEEYPLKTNNRNWDVVAVKLYATPGTARKKNNKWLYGALLILLLGASFFIVDSLNKKQADSSTKSQLTTFKKNYNSDKSTTKTSENSTNNFADDPIQEQLHLNSKNTGNFNHKFTYSESKASVKNTNINLSNTSQGNNLFADQTQLSQQSKLNANNSNQSVNSIIPQKDKPNTTNNNIAANSLNNSNKKGKPDLTVNEKSEHINLRPQPKTFYGMFFFSPDFSTVKFQHINKPGYSIGVALGYRFSNRISVEIGLQRIHANFYSIGKYFDTSNFKLKGKTILDDLNGNNKTTEVPVAIRYNLLKNNDHLFATAGTTVALITHAEKYDYNVIKNGEQRDVYRKFSALTGTKFFSSINLSVGYQTPVANLFDVKIEPYYHAATKGLGIGNLPVSNFGVNIGIIKSLK